VLGYFVQNYFFFKIKAFTIVTTKPTGNIPAKVIAENETFLT
jgi:hypothetical protein